MKQWSVTLGLLCGLFLGGLQNVLAQEPAYLKDMPTVSEIKESIKGANEAQTLGRQCAAFRKLWDWIPFPDNQTEMGRALIVEYRKAISQLDLQFSQNIKSLGDNKNYSEWNRMCQNGRSGVHPSTGKPDNDYPALDEPIEMDKLAAALFKPSVMAVYNQEKAKPHVSIFPPLPPPPPKDENMFVYILLAIALLLITFFLYSFFNSRGNQNKRKIKNMRKILKNRILWLIAFFVVSSFGFYVLIDNRILGLLLVIPWLFFGTVFVLKKLGDSNPRIIYKIQNTIEIQDINEWKKLGYTQEEREKNIKKLFDRKDGTISFATIWDFENDRNYITFHISRNLATMEQQERNFLRTAFLLRNIGKLDDDQWRHYRFALINGNGKASIDESSYCVDNTEIKDRPTLIKYYQDIDNASVDSAINKLLKVIESLTPDGVNDKLIAEIKRGIPGDGGGIWLTDDDIEGSVFNGNGNYQLSLGLLEDSNTVYHYSGEGSLITIAPTRSGKTQCLVLPNMLNWPGAALVLDIKGEIYSATHKWREKNVGPVFKFSPLDPNTSNSYNPLAFVRKDSDWIWEDSRFLADMMIVPSGAADPFWENMARDVLTAAIAYVSFSNEPDDRPMSKVLDLIYGIEWDEMIVALKTNIFVQAMRQTGHALSEMDRKTRDGILKTAQASLSAWQGERIAKVTKKSDWHPLDLRTGKPTIYICINPNEIDSYLSVLRVFIAQHIRTLIAELPAHGVAPILFMLDEFPKLKKMPPIEEALVIGAGFGIKLWMFAQNLGQIKEAYPNAEGIFGGCAVQTFMNLPLNDELTTKISERLGDKQNYFGNTPGKVVTPVELAGPNYRDYILAIATGTKPIKLRKKFAYDDPELKQKMNL